MAILKSKFYSPVEHVLGRKRDVAFILYISTDTNEQLAMRPLVRRIIEDFGLSKFIVCTDIGLSYGEKGMCIELYYQQKKRYSLY